MISNQAWVVCGGCDTLLTGIVAKHCLQQIVPQIVTISLRRTNFATAATTTATATTTAVFMLMLILLGFNGLFM